MNDFHAAVLYLLIAAVAGCGPSTAEYENLQIERDELYADSQSYQRQLAAAQDNHARAVNRLEARIDKLKTQLLQERSDARILRDDLRKKEEDYDQASEVAMNAATSAMSLIKENNR